MKASLFAAAVAAAVLAPAQVFAQDVAVEGPGYKVGESTVLHPTVGAEAGYISNVFYEDNTPKGSALMRVLARLALASRPPERLEIEGAESEEETQQAQEKLDFRAELRLAYEEFLTTDNQVQAQRNLGVGADLHLGILPKSTFPITLDDSFMRTNRPTNFESDRVINRDINNFKAQLGFQPGGRTILMALRYENLLDVFEGGRSDFADRMNQSIGFRSEWQWLPITKFHLDVSYGFFGGLGSASESYKASSNPIRAVAGVDSAITERTTVRVSAGYAYGSYSAGEGFSGMLFGSEFGFRYSPTGRFTLGYTHNYADSINANYFGEHAIRAGLDQQIGPVLMAARAAGRLRGYRGINPMIGAPSRDDVILDGGLRGQYVIQDWIAITGDLELATVQTDYVSMAGGGSDDPSYDRMQLMLGAAAAF